MSRYIDADKLKQRLMVGSELDPEPCKGFRSALLAMVDTQEDADVRENVHGKWVWMSSTYDRSPCEMEFWCDKCHHKVITHGHDPWENFCPYCGAQMDERRENV